MPVRNASSHIERALISIERYASPFRYEVLLADGQSSDNTLEIAQAHGAKIVSKHDTSLYEGLNQAIGKAEGQYAFWLNGDDELGFGFSELADAALSTGADLATGDAERLSLDGEVAPIGHVDRRLSDESILFGVPAINSRLLKLTKLKEAGKFRTDVGVGADVSALLSLRRVCENRIAKPAMVYRYHGHAGSSTMAGDAMSAQRVYESALKIRSVAAGRGEIDEELLDYYHFRSSLALSRSWLRQGKLLSCANEIATLGAKGNRTIQWLTNGLRLHYRYRGVGSGW